jgi:NAD(P)H-dependent FMN reductase
LISTLAECYFNKDDGGKLKKIDVEIFRQPHYQHCVPASVKMVLDYLRKKYGTRIPILSDKKIAEILETRSSSGTNFLGVRK